MHLLLASDAERDLAEIDLYLDQLPIRPARRIALEIREMFRLIADNPHIGMAHSDLTRVAGQEVRSRLCGTYRIYYRFGQAIPEVFAVRHTARDSQGVLTRRLQ